MSSKQAKGKNTPKKPVKKQTSDLKATEPVQDVKGEKKISSKGEPKDEKKKTSSKKAPETKKVSDKAPAKSSGKSSAKVSEKAPAKPSGKNSTKGTEKPAKGKTAKDPAKAMRANLEDLLTRKFFYVPSFEIYGGVAGLYDFGPPGSAIMSNLQTFWRQHFVLTENMLEVSCSALTPHVVLKTSGHVDKFSDFMVRDKETGDCHRADKIVEEHVDKVLNDPKAHISPEQREELLHVRTMAGAYTQDEMAKALVKYGVKAPETGNDVSEPFPFNLMFETQIGPTGKQVGYLRPETAQGIFVNFKRLLDSNSAKMPFAAAQIGLAFRNEISPRSGLIRVREFPLAEIEHFCNPNDKSHPKFPSVAALPMQLLSREAQTGEDVSVVMTMGEAVARKVVNNETLGYFMARTHLFLVACGIKENRLRFRQHKSNEMAHYAADCWDAEIHTSYGWVECVGHADRAAFDLQVHTRASKVELIASEQLSEPMVETCLVPRPNSAKFGPTFRDQGKPLMAHLSTLSQEDLKRMQTELASGSTVVQLQGKEFTLTPELFSVQLETTKTSVLKYIPAVIEPSFGLGRIIYGILEHSFVEKEKNGETQRMLHLTPLIAPTKCAILPISCTPELEAIARNIERDLVRYSMSYKTDLSGASVGRKYARADEIGVPFGITIDFETPVDNSVTLRDRNTTNQIRVPMAQAAGLIAHLCRGQTTWADAYAKYPHFGSGESE